MVTDGDHTCHGERCIIYRIVESLCCILETYNIVILVYRSNIIQLKKQKQQNSPFYWWIEDQTKDGKKKFLDILTGHQRRAVSGDGVVGRL